MFDLNGKRALVTGATQGIGLAAAARLGEAGRLFISTEPAARINACGPRRRFRVGCRPMPT